VTGCDISYMIQMYYFCKVFRFKLAPRARRQVTSIHRIAEKVHFPETRCFYGSD
jgi:hypothetical protein